MARRRRGWRSGARRAPVVLEGRLFAWRARLDGELHRAPVGFAPAFTICGVRLAGLMESRVEPSEAGLVWCTECWNVPPSAGGGAVSSTVVKDLGGGEWEL